MEVVLLPVFLSLRIKQQFVKGKQLRLQQVRQMAGITLPMCGRKMEWLFLEQLNLSILRLPYHMEM